MATVNKIDSLMSDLDISNEENEELVLDVESEETENRFKLCLVGKFLIEKLELTNIIPVGGDLTKVSHNIVKFWIQIYDLPSGYMSELVGKQLGNFFGSFVSYDLSNNTGIWHEYMKIRIMVDVCFPLKRKKKICKKNKSEFIVNCKYEKLGDFCFVCGLLTHTKNFCKKKIGGEVESSRREWGPWLRAPPRRQDGQGRGKWLLDEGDVNWGKQ
ncbi:hypothetical protein AgCh_032742 [Apium graveolens]